MASALTEDGSEVHYECAGSPSGVVSAGVGSANRNATRGLKTVIGRKPGRPYLVGLFPILVASVLVNLQLGEVQAQTGARTIDVTSSGSISDSLPSLQPGEEAITRVNWYKFTVDNLYTLVLQASRPAFNKLRVCLYKEMGIPGGVGWSGDCPEASNAFQIGDPTIGEPQYHHRGGGGHWDVDPGTYYIAIWEPFPAPVRYALSYKVINPLEVRLSHSRWTLVENHDSNFNNYFVQLSRPPLGHYLPPTGSIVSADTILEKPVRRSGVLTIVARSDSDGPGGVSIQPATLTFTTENWNVPQYIKIRAHDDPDSENQVVRIRHTMISSDGSVLLGNPQPIRDFVIAVVDNDFTPDVAVFEYDGSPLMEPATIKLDEGEKLKYWVGLRTPEELVSFLADFNEDTSSRLVDEIMSTQSPSRTVTVTITSDNPDVRVSPDTLQFTSSRTTAITVSAHEDVDIDHDTATLNFTVTGFEGRQANGGQATVEVSDNDKIVDDSIGVLFSAQMSIYGGEGVFVLDPSESELIHNLNYVELFSGRLGIVFRKVVARSEVNDWVLSFDPPLTPDLAFKDAEFGETFSVGSETYSAYTWTGVSADFQDGGLVTLRITRDQSASRQLRPNIGVCDRTPQVRDAIFSAVNKRKCEDITAADLASIRYLPSFSGKGIARLKSGDFAGLSKLESLELGGNDLADLPGDVFSDLSRLKTLNLHGNDLTGLPANVFAGLPSLEVLRLGDNRLTALDASLFAGLSRLDWLDLASNRLTALPSWVFRGLANLKRLDLQGNQLTALPLDIFVGLGRLVALHLERNRLAMLPAGIFADLAGLRRLNLEHNRLSSLPHGLFTGISLSSKLILGSDQYLRVSPGTYLRLGFNPGAPFSLTLELERRDHPSPSAPGPALVRVNLVPSGDSQMSLPLPFDLPLGIWARDGTLSGSARIAAGQLESEDLTIHQSHPVLQVPIGKPVTVGLYVDSWMDPNPHGFRSSGVSIKEGRPLVLFGGHVNEDALPRAPAAPTFGPVFVDGLPVRWTAPDNTGRPPITRWVLQYRQVGEIAWTAGPSIAPEARETAIADLVASAAYEVRVRAVNREGAGAWSPPATTATSAALISFGAASYPVTEGGIVSVTVLLDRPFGLSVNIPLTTTPGVGADAGDYAVPGSVSFEAGEVTQTVIFQAHAEPDAEIGHEVTLGFGTLPTGLATGSTTTAVVTIYDPVADNTPPTFDGPTVFNVTENSTHVGTLVAIDTNAGDSVTGYTFAGGIDDRQFTLGAETGVLEFARLPDHESPADNRSTDPSNSANDNVYVVKVRATSGTGNRVLATVRTVLVTVTNAAEPPGCPVPPQFGSAGPDNLTVTWGAPSNKGPAIHRYDIRYKADSDSGFTDGPQGVAGLSTVITGLRARTDYEVQVRAGNAEGDGEWSASGVGTTLAPEVTVPEMPASLTAAAMGRNVIELSWDASESDGGSPITGYRIEVSTDGGRRWTTLADTGRTANSYNHTDLAAGTARHYRVSAINAAGVGAASAEARAVTAAAVVPSEPWIVGANSRNGQVELVWYPPAHDGGSPITGYEVRFDGEGAWRRIARTWIGGSNANTVFGVVRGLASDRPYTFEVRATNEAGAGAASRPSASITPKGGFTPAAGVTISPLTMTVPEGGAASYTVRLTARPTHRVHVHPFWPGGDRDLTRGMQRYVPLTFGPDDWQITRTVTVEAATDVDSTNGTTVFRHLLQSEDPRYDDWWAAEVVATERDTVGTAGGRTTSPAVAGLSVTTGPGTDGVWSAGDVVEVTATFRQPVAVEVSGGTPSVAILLGGARREAVYARGSGTASLVLVYKVVTADGRNAAVRVAGEGIALNGGKIQSASTGIDPTLAPSVTEVEIALPPDRNPHWGVGEKVTVRVIFSEPVFADTRYGVPSIGIVIGGARLAAAYTGGSGSVAMTFAYMVTASDGSVEEVFVPADGIVLGGATIQDADGNDALLVHSATRARATTRPPSISVADARAREGAGAALAFRMTLSPIATSTVTVDYQTFDGTAKAGEDYRAVAGTLTFAPGETAKTVRVSVIDDATDEGEETFTLTLSNAKGGAIADGEAKGVIVNADHMPRAWLSRFGRTVAGHIADAVSERVTAPPLSSQVTLAGQRIELARADNGQELAEALAGFARTFGAPSSEDDDPFARHGLSDPWSDRATVAPARPMTGRELLLGSAFHLATGAERSGPGLAAWGRVAHGRFDGEHADDTGRTGVDGEVLTGVLGADAEWNRVLAGVSVSLSEGDGSFDSPGADVGGKGGIESRMTTVSPYARVKLTERVSVWGLAGWGTGAMTIRFDDGSMAPVRTDLSMQLGAVGARGVLLTQDQAGGMDLALKADAFLVRTESEKAANSAETQADASRLRLVLEGGRRFDLGGGVTVRPSLELGVRHDGGDAETGTGVEVGGGVAFADTGSGLSIEAKARMLVAHADSDYEEWGASATARLDPGERGRGLSFSLAPTIGATSSASERLWGAHDARGLAPGGEFEAARGLAAEAGYGMALFGDRFTGTPNLGFGMSDGGARDWRIGWRLTSAVPGDPGFEVNLDATRREAANDNKAEHGVMLRSLIRW